MRIQVKEEPFKAVLFWLSKQEAADKEGMATLKAIFPSIKEEGYLPVIYESGDGDLEESITLLIKNHIYEMAKESLKNDSGSQRKTL